MMRKIILVSFCFPFLLQAMAAFEVLTAQATQVAVTQDAMLRVSEVAIDVQTATSTAQFDAMFRYDHIYDAMQNEHVAQTSLQDVVAHTSSADVMYQPIAASSHEVIPEVQTSASTLFRVESMRNRVVDRLQFSPMLSREFRAFGDQHMYVRDVLIEPARRSPSFVDDSFYDRSHVFQGSGRRETEPGYTKNDIISAIRGSREVRLLIDHINERFVDIAQAFEQAVISGDFHELLDLLAQMRLDIKELNSLGPVSYLLIPEISTTIKHIELPLLECATGKRDALCNRDYEQITWAIEGHLKNMQRYTQHARVVLPDGVLKNIVDAHNATSFFGRLYNNIRYYSTFGVRDLKGVQSLRDAYQEMRAQNVASQSEQSQVVDTLYSQLLQEVKLQSQNYVEQQGVLSAHYQAREHALEQMVQDSTRVYKKTYALNEQVTAALEQVGIDIQQFAKCDGNHIQQDTHAKLVHSLNKFACARPQTEQGKLIQEGMFDLAEAGNALNQIGEVREAILASDVLHAMVEYGWRSLDAVCGINIGSIKDIFHFSESIQHICESFEQARIGATKGYLCGITDIQGICNGICDSVKTVAQGVYDVGMFMAEQDAFTDAIDQGRLLEAEMVVQGNQERAQQLRLATDQMCNEVSAFCTNIEHMTPQDWHDAGLAFGELVGRETGTFYTTGKMITGIGKIVRGVSESANKLNTFAKEITFAHGLSGESTLVYRAGVPVEQVSTLGFSRGIADEVFNTVTQPSKVSSRVILADEIVASSELPAAYKGAAAWETAKGFFAEAQPGCIDLAPRQPIRAKDKLLSEVRQFENERVLIGKHSFLIDKKGLKHILQRHHPDFWNGTIAPTQTYLPKEMTIKEIVKIIKQVLRENRSVLICRGTVDGYQVESVINGVKYVVGTKKGRIGQFYIKK